MFALTNQEQSFTLAPLPTAKALWLGLGKEISEQK